MNFESLTRRFNFYLSTFELLTWSQKIKSFIWVANSKIKSYNSSHKNKKLQFQSLTRSWKIDKWKKILNYYSFKMTRTGSLYYVYLYLPCFFVSTYVIIIWVCWILIVYGSSTTFLFTRLQKTFSSCEPKEKWPYILNVFNAAY